MTTASLCLAARGRREGVDRAGERERVGAGHVGRPQARRPRHVADADDLRVARRLRPGRRERAERVLARGGQVAGRSSTGSARRSGPRRAPTRRSPMRQSRESTSATARGRVFTDGPGKTARATPAALATASAPPDPRRVLRREGREAEVARGVVLGALRADRRLRRRASPPRPPPFPPQAATTAPDSARAASRSARRRICAGR